MFKKYFLTLFILLLTLGTQQALAQISIAPIMLFMDEQNPFGTIMVMNGSEDVQEVSIEFPFGYPVTDDVGNVQMVYDDSTTAEEWGIEDNIRGFPQNFTLQPGQRQVVRLQVRPQDFVDGMYWSRIRTTSTPQTPEIGETSDEEITTQISYKFEQVTTAFYKHGEVSTGIDIQSMNVAQNTDTIQFIADVERTGNAPFLGSIELTVRDDNGNTVLERRTSTSIYFDYRQIFEATTNELPAGDYTAEIGFFSQRSDIPQNSLVQMEPISESVNVTIK